MCVSIITKEEKEIDSIGELKKFVNSNDIPRNKYYKEFYEGVEGHDSPFVDDDSCLCCVDLDKLQEMFNLKLELDENYMYYYER